MSKKIRMFNLLFSTVLLVLLTVCLNQEKVQAAGVYPDQLQLGERLNFGEQLTSPNGEYRAVVQSDGNLGVYRTSDGAAIFSALSAGKPISTGYYATLQYDGNFAVKDGNNAAVWYTGTQNQSGYGGNVVKLLNDGSLAVLSSNRIIWKSNGDPKDTLTVGEKLYIGQQLTSQNGEYKAVVQTDGNLGVYKISDGTAIFSALSAGKPISNGYYATLQYDGNFAVKGIDDAVVWYTHTQNQTGYSANIVKLLNDGSLAVLSSNRCIWKTTGVARDKLTAGERLYSGQKLTSPNGEYTLEVQTDGNLGIYRAADHVPVYGALSVGKPISYGYYATLQYDGNFAVKDGDNAAVWYTATQNRIGYAANIVRLMDNGTLQVFSGSQSIWSTPLPPRDTIKLGERLNVGEKLTSRNGAYKAIVQTDGNLGVFRLSDGAVLYSALSQGQPISSAYYATLQYDGNFAVKSGSGAAVWYTGTQNENGYANYVKLMDDGTLQVFSGTKSIWSTPKPPKDTLTLGEVLYIGQQLTSIDGAYKAVVQSDGNFGIYKISDGTAVFSALSVGQPISSGYYATLQYDGNFAVKAENGAAVWYTGTQNKNGYGNYVKLMTNGTIQIFSGSESIWSSPLPGSISSLPANYGGLYSYEANKIAQINYIDTIKFGTALNNIKYIYDSHKATYDEIARRSGVPAQLVTAIHYRESSCNFSTYLHNGDPLGYPTTHVPVGVYFTNFTDAAVDALLRFSWLRDKYGLNAYSRDMAAMMAFAETYNGLGYYNRGRTSPYVYSGTNVYTSGKYVADGYFDPYTIDRQPGVYILVNKLLN